MPVTAFWSRVTVPRTVLIDDERSCRMKRSTAGQPTHTLAWQVLPAGHLTPQLPQLLGSLVVSAQTVPHCLLVPGHAQAPAWQTVPAGHWLAQFPQWAG